MLLNLSYHVDHVLLINYACFSIFCDSYCCNLLLLFATLFSFSSTVSEGSQSDSYGASSDLTPSSAVFRNPLIGISFQEFRTQFQNLDEKYNLASFPVQEYNGPPIKASAINESEQQAMQYTINLLDIKSWPSLEFEIDREVTAFTTHLQPFTSSLVVRPDCIVFRSTGKKEQLPMLCMEVHSGSADYVYINTVAKSVANLIDQLRLLRCFYPKLDKVSGFVWPKKAKVRKYLTCVTQVDVHWEDFRFYVNFDVLEKTAVPGTVKQVIENQLVQLQTSPLQKNKQRFFVRLGPEDLGRICALVSENDAEKFEQVQSKFSIIVRSPRKYYKVLPREEEELRMRKFIDSASPSVIEGIVMPTRWYYKGSLCFYEFDTQDEPPLNREDAAKCLGDLVKQLVSILERIHKLGWAHLDIHLPNICFTRGGQIRLIDLDRVHSKYDICLDEYHHSFLYQIPRSIPITGVDWRQLGVLIYSVLRRAENPVRCRLGYSHLSELKKIPFLKELVVDYKMQHASLEKWLASLEPPLGTRSILDVLQERRLQLHSSTHVRQ